MQAQSFKRLVKYLPWLYTVDICKQMLASAINGDDEPQSITFAVIMPIT